MCSSLAALSQRSTRRSARLHPCSPPPADRCLCRRCHAARPPPAADSPPSPSGRCALPCGAADLLSHAPCTAARLWPLHFFPTSLSKPPALQLSLVASHIASLSYKHPAASFSSLLWLASLQSPASASTRPGGRHGTCRHPSRSSPTGTAARASVVSRGDGHPSHIPIAYSTPRPTVTKTLATAAGAPAVRCMFMSITVH